MNSIQRKIKRECWLVAKKHRGNGWNNIYILKRIGGLFIHYTFLLQSHARQWNKTHRFLLVELS